MADDKVPDPPTDTDPSPGYDDGVDIGADVTGDALKILHDAPDDAEKAEEAGKTDRPASPRDPAGSGVDPKVEPVNR